MTTYAKPELCPDCGSRFKETITQYGILRQCVACTVRQWCDLEGVPKGSPGNAFVRRARERAHVAFDPLWKNGHMSRDAAYVWLAGEMGVAEIHMGELTTEQCLEVERIANNELAIRRAKIRRVV